MPRLLLLLIVLLLALPARAQSAVDGALVEPELAAVRLGDEVRPRIDGRLDEAVWAQAPAASGFVQREPSPGQASSERTEVRLLYDDTALYVGFRNYVSDPETFIARLARRDEWVVTDRVSVDIDSNGGGQTGYSFAVTAAGVQQDYLLFNDTQEDVTWDAVYDVATARFEDGWTAEFRIPLSQLRFAASEGAQAWGIQFQRDIPANGEVSFWAPILPDVEGYVSRFGSLQGLTGLRPPRRLEATPYAALRLTRDPAEQFDPDDPFFQENAFAPNAGLDLNVGITSDLTLTATLNPDFGQVEADPADVNLTQFETFFEERRPFFVEGTDLFEFGSTRTYQARFRPTFFYSRRIGRQPQIPVVVPGVRDLDVAYLDAPDQTTIAGAAKLTGQIGGWQVGVLDAVTTSENAAYLTTSGERLNAAVEPWSNYLVARGRRSLRGGRTRFGLFGSAATRQLNEPAFEQRLPSSALALGGDFETAWDNRRWVVSSVVAGSRVAGTSGPGGVITRLQQASSRYFQRPDAGYLDLDTTRSALGGLYTEVSLAKRGGTWRGSLTGVLATPGLELNDLGFLTRTDVAGASGRLSYNENRAGAAWLQRYSVALFSDLHYNLGGDRIETNLGVEGTAVLSNLWTVIGRVLAQPQRVNDRLTRGGPLTLRPAAAQAVAFVGTDARRDISGSLQATVRTDASGEYDYVVQVGLTARPLPALRASLEPRVVWGFDTDQYLGRVTAAETTATFGRRYLFADVTQRAFDLGLRVDWTFSPNLSLQLYAAPYIDGRRFDGFKELEAARTYDFVVYGEDRGSVSPLTADGMVTGYAIDPGDGGAAFSLPNRDFTFRSLRGNAVLRWEYRPGSTLFFVWQQQRDAFGPQGDLELGRDLDNLFGDPVQNVFLVKATYWFGG